VTPNISLDGEVSVDIDLTVSSLGEAEISPKKAKYYRINQRKTKTTLTAKDNETQILAGLIDRQQRSNTAGLPGASRVPFLDRLLGTRGDETSNSELVLVITPHIERQLELPGAHVSTFISGTESRVSGDSLVLRSTEGARVTTGGTRPAVAVDPEPEQPAPVLEPLVEPVPSSGAAPRAAVPPPVPDEKARYFTPGIGTSPSVVQEPE
jgi:general secretion pathway protein D